MPSVSACAHAALREPLRWISAAPPLPRPRTRAASSPSISSRPATSSARPTRRMTRGHRCGISALPAAHLRDELVVDPCRRKRASNPSGPSTPRRRTNESASRLGSPRAPPAARTHTRRASDRVTCARSDEELLARPHSLCRIDVNRCGRSLGRTIGRSSTRAELQSGDCEVEHGTHDLHDRALTTPPARQRPVARCARCTAVA